MSRARRRDALGSAVANRRCRPAPQRVADTVTKHRWVGCVREAVFRRRRGDKGRIAPSKDRGPAGPALTRRVVGVHTRAPVSVASPARGGYSGGARSPVRSRFALPGAMSLTACGCHRRSVAFACSAAVSPRARGSARSSVGPRASRVWPAGRWVARSASTGTCSALRRVNWSMRCMPKRRRDPRHFMIATCSARGQPAARSGRRASSRPPRSARTRRPSRACSARRRARGRSR